MGRTRKTPAPPKFRRGASPIRGKLRPAKLKTKPVALGVRFGCRLQADRYEELHEMQRRGEIRCLTTMRTFELRCDGGKVVDHVEVEFCYQRQEPLFEGLICWAPVFESVRDRVSELHRLRIKWLAAQETTVTVKLTTRPKKYAK